MRKTTKPVYTGKSTEQLTKAFAFISRAGAKLDAFIQETAIATLEHYQHHKDARIVDRLYLSMPKGARHVAMAEFILQHFAVTANTDQATKKDRPFLNAPDKVNDVEGAKAKPWYDHKASPNPDQIMDVQAMVRAILNKVAKGKVVVGADKLQALADVVGIPASDVPTGVTSANSIEEARAILAKTDTLGLS